MVQLSALAGLSGEPILFTLTLNMKPSYNQLFSHYETDLNMVFNVLTLKLLYSK